MAQGLAFLFGAPLTFRGPVCLRTRFQRTYLFEQGCHHVGFWASHYKTNPVTFRTCTLVQGEVTFLTSQCVTLRGDGFSTW